MAELANLFVTIGTKFDASGFKAASDKLDVIKEKTEKMAGAFKTAGFALVGMAAVGAGAMVSLIKNAADAEKATELLAGAMKQAGNYTDEALKHNIAYAVSLAKITTCTDDEILSVERLLTNYGIEGEMLDALTKSTLDLAAASGMDLSSAATLLAKSVSTSTNALSRYGIEIEGTKGSTTRMQSAVEAIDKVFGGTAETMGSTFSGQVTILKNRFGELQETLGTILLPKAEKFLNFVDKAITWLEKLSPEMKSTIASFLLYGTIIAGSLGSLSLFLGYLPKIVGALTLMRKAVGGVNAVLGGGLGYIALIVAAYVAAKVLVGWVGKLIDKFDEQKGAEAKLAQTTKGRILQYEQEKEAIVKNLRDKKFTTEQIKEHTDRLGKLNNAIKLQTTIMDEENKKQALSHTEKTDIVNENIGKQIMTEEQGQVVLEGIWEAEQYKFVTGWKNAWDEFADGPINWYESFTTVLGDVQGALATGFTQMYTDGVDTWDEFSKVVDGIWETIKLAIVQQLANITAQYIVQTGIMKAAALVWAGLEWVYQTSIIAARTVAGWSVIPFVGTALGIAAAVALVSEMVGKFKNFATGGLVTGATMAMIGEAGTEMVLPLENPRSIDLLSKALSMAGTTNNVGGNTITVNVPIDNLRNRNKAKELGQIVGDEIFKKIKMSRKVL